MSVAGGRRSSSKGKSPTNRRNSSANRRSSAGGNSKSPGGGAARGRSPGGAKAGTTTGATSSSTTAAATSSSSSSSTGQLNTKAKTQSASKTTATAAANRARNKTPLTSLARKRKMAALVKQSGRGRSAAKDSELQPVLEPEEVDDDVDSEPKLQPDLRGDYGNVAILLALYTLQGIPMGFASTIPLLLKERGVSYSLIGLFSMTHWPFSMKLLWAPIVDSCYMDKVGRRKTWLIPTQLFIGVVLILLSNVFNEWCGGLDMHHPDKTLGEINMTGLTASFFFLYFLCATQDIAVDGWALTILREENVGYQSMCNGAGQTLGYAFAFIGALSLNHFKILGFDQFMYLCGVAFLITTMLVGVFKSEKPVAKDEEVEGLYEVYKQLLAMWRLRTIRGLVAILFFWKIPFAGCEAIVTLKMQDHGIPKEHIAYIGAACTVLSVFVPLILSKWTSGNRPFDVCISLYLPRILMCFVSMAMVYYCPNVAKLPEFPIVYYFLIGVTSIIGVFISTTMFVAQMSYYAKVSPKDIGGTYMTLLNTFGNMGSMWVTPLAFSMVDWLTVTQPNPLCLKNPKDTDCKPTTVVDGFYVMSAICAVVGFLGYSLLRRKATTLQNFPKSEWKIVKA
ncbi:unnamed protein product [Amoebophrya sp. A120]|nr:unnamed protein product [Amoebophrya sp. A120]|eukprot:GSA120T00004963001.1